MSDNTKGIIAIISMAVMCGFNGAIIRFMTGMGLNVYSLNFMELVFGLPITFIIARRLGERITFPTKEELPYLVTTGICLFLLTMAFFFAFNFTSIANVVFLHYTSPIFTLFGASIFLNERIDKWKVLALCFCILGLIMILKPNLGIDNRMIVGDLLAFLSAFPAAATTIIGRKLRHRSAYFTTFWRVFYAALFYLPFFIFYNTISSIEQIVFIFLVSVWYVGIALPLYFYALRHIQASTTEMLLLMEILSAIMVGLLLYREIPSTSDIIGGLFIITGGIAVMTKVEGVKFSVRKVD